ncbi:ABC transporter permease [Knoellia locipacati]|uniref:ABC transporter permease n=1 Tax=Knoellia locipacati TaxID=882824 RepID=UPI00384BFD65
MSTTVAEGIRPSDWSIVRSQVRYATTEYWRARLVLIFSLFIPLTWLLVIGAVAGNDVLDGTGGLRVMQFATPVALSMGALYAALPTTASTLAHARETRVLVRLRGTPTPMWAYLAGRAVGASVFALISMAVVLVAAVVVHDVRVVASTLPATLVTLTLALVCYVVVGLALAAWIPSGSTAQAVSIGAVVILSFVSGLYTGFGSPLPEALDRTAALFPVKPVTEALQDQFNPVLPGAGLDLSLLVVLAVWTVAAGVLAARGLSRERAGLPWSRRPHRPAGPGSVQAGEAARVAAAAPVGRGRRRRSGSAASMVADQVLAGLRLTWRDPGAVFFAVLVPVGLYAFLSTMTGDPSLASGVPPTTHHAASMIAWGVGVTAFMNLPESVAQARDRGVLKRLRGTPLCPLQLLVGRVVTTVLVNLALAALILTLGVVALDLSLTGAGVLVLVVVIVVGTLSLAAAGFLLATVVPGARALGAVALVVLLPLAFVSDVLLTGGPEWMGTVGSAFPLRHLQHALVAALDPGGAAVPWVAIGVMLAWMLAAGAAAVRWFRWQADPA